MARTLDKKRPEEEGVDEIPKVLQKENLSEE